MKNPFKVGDQVYTTASSNPWKVTDVSDPKYVRLGLNSDEISIKCVSFKPWPAPCHERPIEDGWYVVSHNNVGRFDDPHVRLVKSGRVHFMHSTYPLAAYTLHTYLGKDWK